MLVLGKGDIDAIATPKGILGAVENAFRLYSRGEFDMPLRFSYDSGAKNLLYMPCFTKEVFGTKMLTVFPENRTLGIPAIDGLMLLNDLTTGKPLCVIDAKQLTALRTGAVGAGMGSKYLTSPETDSVCLVGCGAQGLHQLMFCCQILSVKAIYLYDPYLRDFSVFMDKVKTFCAADTAITVCGSAAEAAERAQLILTATTANTPVFP
jgi:ornithine cyclodeaminase/alanine dehydrogenase-like protein (mu-crystallin family)